MRSAGLLFIMARLVSVCVNARAISGQYGRTTPRATMLGRVAELQRKAKGQG